MAKLINEIDKNTRVLSSFIIGWLFLVQKICGEGFPSALHINSTCAPSVTLASDGTLVNLGLVCATAAMDNFLLKFYFGLFAYNYLFIHIY